MNTRNLPASALFAVMGAAAILFIGAFARFDTASRALVPPPIPSAPLVTQDDPPAEAPTERPMPANLSPGLSEVIKLAQAHVDQSLILSYIKNSHQTYAPTADEILYLSDLGLSQNVIGALIGSPPPVTATQPPPEIAAAPEPADTAQPEPDVMTTVFYNELAPYGTWTQQPGYGSVWQPTVDTINSDWTPYVDGGQWLYSDNGWYWQSDYSWGWAVFHYGRWANIPRKGWVWQPDNVWSPAWVAWRSTSSYIGWAPLPPGVSLNVLAQLTYNSKPVPAKATLGLPASAYTFVNVTNLASRNPRRRAMPAPRVSALVEASGSLMNNYQIVNNRIVNGGASVQAVSAGRQKPVHQVALRAASSPDAAGMAMDRQTLTVYVPPTLSSSSAATQSESVAEKSRSARGRDAAVMADNDVAQASSYSTANPDNVAVQLPPLRYPQQRGWSSGYAAATPQFPSTAAPRLEGYNPPARQYEAARVNTEARPAPVENHHQYAEPAHAEPAHASPAPLASSSGTSSKSGK